LDLGLRIGLRFRIRGNRIINIMVMKTKNNFRGKKLPVKLPDKRTHSLTSLNRLNKNAAELKNGIVLYLHFDGIQIVDLLRYLRENSLSDQIRSVDPPVKNQGKKLSFAGAKMALGIWIDDNTYLTWREYEIMESMSIGRQIKEIAYDLGLSYNTIRNNLQRIYRKFIVGNKSEAMIYYLKSHNKLNLDSAN
jgi:DNA-binding CsgD family transcriptional regulator